MFRAKSFLDFGGGEVQPAVVGRGLPMSKRVRLGEARAEDLLREFLVQMRYPSLPGV